MREEGIRLETLLMLMDVRKENEKGGNMMGEENE